jgi:50S ribosomal subunit-associated GTPase HflX
LSPEQARALAADNPEAVVISAAKDVGLPALLAAIDRRLPEPWIRVRTAIPYSEPKLLARIYREGRVLSRADGPQGVTIQAEVPGPLAVQLRAQRKPGAVAS